MFDITVIIEAVFALLAAIITAIVIPYIKSKTTASQQAEINAWVKIAVTAAEQIYTGSGRGEEKKAYVLNWLQEHGITVDAEKLDALIEAAVYDLTNNGLIAIEQGVVVGAGTGTSTLVTWMPWAWSTTAKRMAMPGVTSSPTGASSRLLAWNWA